MVAAEEPIGQELHQVFRNIQESQEKLICQNNYFGVPIQHPGVIREVQGNTIILSIHPHQIAAAWTEKKIFLQHSQLPMVLKSVPDSFDFSNRLITLSSYSAAGPSFGKRQSLRVQPKDPIQAIVAQEGIRMTATLADLSAVGVGVYTFAALLHDQVEFRKDDPITVGFTLPTYPHQLVIDGFITNALKMRGNFIRRIGIRVEPQGEAAGALSEYIAARQSEIILQLQSLSRELTREESVSV